VPVGTGPPPLPAAAPGWSPAPARHRPPTTAPRTVPPPYRSRAHSYPEPAATAARPTPPPPPRPPEPPAVPAPLAPPPPLRAPAPGPAPRPTRPATPRQRTGLTHGSPPHQPAGSSPRHPARSPSPAGTPPPALRPQAPPSRGPRNSSAQLGSLAPHPPQPLQTPPRPYHNRGPGRRTARPCKARDSLQRPSSPCGPDGLLFGDVAI
jgi:hypothetical protein